MVLTVTPTDVFSQVSTALAFVNSSPTLPGNGALPELIKPLTSNTPYK